MTVDSADLLFRPRSVAVVGASSDPAKLSGRPVSYLKNLGFRGDLYAVNPRRASVQGIDAYPSIRDVPGPVDLAIIVVPADAVPQAVVECAEASVGAVIIFGSGFAESSDEGREIQDRLSRIARSSGMRILGPNCLGAFSEATGTFATFSTAFDGDQADVTAAPIAMVSQSGAVGTFTFSAMSRLGIGVNYFANTGNEADLTVVELLTSLVEAEDVSVLLGHLEGVRDLDALERLARRADELDKPLVLLKTGRSAAGMRAVAAHTASIAGDDTQFADVLTRHGGVRVESLEGWADAALAFRDGRRGGGDRLTIVTLSGGAGALAADAAVESGLRVDTWDDDEATAAIARTLPAFASVLNPFDLTGAMINDIGLLRNVLDVAVTHPESHSVLVVLGNADAGAEQIVEVLSDAYRATDRPFMVSWTGGSGAPVKQLLARGVPTYTDPVRAVAAIEMVSRRERRRGASSE